MQGVDYRTEALEKGPKGRMGLVYSGAGGGQCI